MRLTRGSGVPAAVHQDGDHAPGREASARRREGVAEPGSHMPAARREGHRLTGVRPLIDGHGRVHRDLRISVTDRCNLRCTYCMPEEGLPWQPRHELLTFEEVERLAALLVRELGIDAIRLTGGEPTVRAHLPVLVERLAALGTDLSITTNAVTLDVHAAPLAAAGLRRANISLDTLRADRFLELTRRPELDRVLAGIDAALAHGLTPLKLNAVVMKGVNDDEVVDLAAFGRTKGVTVRFIEFMPLDASGAWDRDAVVSQDEIVAAIDAVFPVEAVPRGSAPATEWRYRDGQGSIGVIPSVTAPVLRRLRSHPPHLRRQAPHLPLRHHRDRPARPPAGWRERRRAGRPRRRGGAGQGAGPPHRAGHLHPPRPLDVADRRLTGETHRCRTAPGRARSASVARRA